MHRTMVNIPGARDTQNSEIYLLDIDIIISILYMKKLHALVCFSPEADPEIEWEFK